MRMEKYGLDFGPEGKWTSFSVAKSFTSTLVGAAIKDGYIKSIDDKVSAYIPDLKGSAYDEIVDEAEQTKVSGQLPVGLPWYSRLISSITSTNVSN